MMDKEYEEYLASPDWRRERQARIETSGGLCEICRWPLGYKTPHVHHETYANIGHELSLIQKSVMLNVMRTNIATE